MLDTKEQEQNWAHEWCVPCLKNIARGKEEHEVNISLFSVEGYSHTEIRW